MPSYTVRAAVEDLRNQYLGSVERTVNSLEAFMAELSEHGKTRMVEILESAVTQTGIDRVARGAGIAGRVDSGDMRGAIESDSHTEGDTIVAEWGWLDEVRKYFMIQEHGAEVFGVQFEGMHALQGSYVEMREQLRERLEAL